MEVLELGLLGLLYYGRDIEHAIRHGFCTTVFLGREAELSNPEGICASCTLP